MEAEEYYNLGNNCYNAGDYEEAIKYYSKAIELKPDNEVYYSNRAHCYQILCKYDLAIEDFSQGIRLVNDINSLEFYYTMRGECYMDSARFNEAINNYTEILKLTTHEYYYSQRALCYMELKQYEKAITDFTQSIKLEPSSDFSYKYRGECYEVLGKYDKAIADYNKAIVLKKPEDKYMIESLNVGIASCKKMLNQSKMYTKSTKGRKLDL